MSMTAGSSRSVRVAFVTEVHLGHATFAANLRAAVADDPSVDATWVEVRYEPLGRIERLPLPGAVRGALRGAREVAAGWPRDAEVTFFNTQVPATFSRPAARRRPYVLCTDITPVQYDSMAAQYGHQPDRRGPVRWSKHAWNRHVYGGAAHVIGWSSWVHDSLIADYGVEPARAHVIPPGVDLDAWRVGRQRDGVPIRLLFVGGDFARKGGEHVMRAFAALPRGTATLDVVTRDDVAPLDGVRVHHGLTPNSQRLLDLYSAADVFVLPSEAEAFGIAAVEACAAGLAVVATNVGGLPDIVADGVNGLLVPPRDMRSLSRALEALAGDTERVARMGRESRRRAEERFDARLNAKQVLTLLSESAAR